VSHSRIKLCPVVAGRAYSDESVFSLSKPDGWHEVDVLNREYIRASRMQDLLTYKAPVKAYFLRGQLVPKSFDVTKRFEVSLKEYLLGKDQTFQDFDVLAFCKIRNKVFLVRKEASDGALFLPKMKLVNGEKLESAKGLSPEQVYLLGCYAMILAEQKAKLEAENLPNRIKRVFSLTGAKLVEFKTAAKGLIEISWQYLQHTFLSTVYEKDLRVLSSGFCLAGSDSKQTLASLPCIAKEAIEDDKLYITRHVNS